MPQTLATLDRRRKFRQDVKLLSYIPHGFKCFGQRLSLADLPTLRRDAAGLKNPLNRHARMGEASLHCFH